MLISSVDLGGSFAVASRGLYSTGVSTDLNGELSAQDCRTMLTIYTVTYLSSGGKVGDKILAVCVLHLFIWSQKED